MSRDQDKECKPSHALSEKRARRASNKATTLQMANARQKKEAMKTGGPWLRVKLARKGDQAPPVPSCKPTPYWELALLKLAIMAVGGRSLKQRKPLAVATTLMRRQGVVVGGRVAVSPQSAAIGTTTPGKSFLKALTTTPGPGVV